MGLQLNHVVVCVPKVVVGVQTQIVRASPHYLPPMRILLLLALWLVLAKAALAQDTYLHCGRLLDATSTAVKTEQTVIIRDGKILEVRSGYTLPPSDATLVDLKEHLVTPGWMDMHVHIESENNPKTYELGFRQNPADIAFDAAVYARRTLLAGFTTVRDLGGSGRQRGHTQCNQCRQSDRPAHLHS